MLLQAFPFGPSGLEMATILLLWLLVVVAVIRGLRRLDKFTTVSLPETVLNRSPVDFKSAIAYSLQEDMRRLIITFIAGLLLSSTGWSLFANPELYPLIILLNQTIGLVLLLIGVPLLIGGLVGSAFKILTDAFILAMKQ